MRLPILAFLLFCITPTLAFANAPKCGTARIVVDHPAYEFHLQGGAGALYDMDNNIIALSTEFMTSRPPNVQRFIFAHECGHYKLKGGTEIGADNYALDTAKRQGWTLDERDLNYICYDVGAERCDNIRKKTK
jgi:hypothetical protein